MPVDRPAGSGSETGDMDPYRRIAELESRIRNLQDAVTSHERIGVATGLLAQRLDRGPDQAWELLVWLSQKTNVKVRDVARVLIDAHTRRVSEADTDLARTLDGLLPDGRVITLPG